MPDALPPAATDLLQYYARRFPPPRWHRRPRYRWPAPEPQQIERSKGADNGDRNRQQRDDRRAPGLQEQDDHQNHQQHRFKQGIYYRADRIAYEHRRVVRRFPAHAVRKTGRQLGHFGPHRIGQFDGIGTRCLEDTNPHRVFIIELGTQRIAAGTHFNTRHVTQADDLAVVAAFENDITELFLSLQAALRVDRQQVIAAGRHRFRPQLAGGNLHVLLLHGGNHVRGRQPA
ncbi:hypothetical protein D3C72_1487090 [compost metagenome]